MTGVAGTSHAKCSDGHICQEPSGLACDEAGCDEPAGTWWGPFWCPHHDKERLDNVSRGLASVAADFGGASMTAEPVTGVGEVTEPVTGVDRERLDRLAAEIEYDSSGLAREAAWLLGVAQNLSDENDRLRRELSEAKALHGAVLSQSDVVWELEQGWRNANKRGIADAVAAALPHIREQIAAEIECLAAEIAAHDRSTDGVSLGRAQGFRVAFRESAKIARGAL